MAHQDKPFSQTFAQFILRPPQIGGSTLYWMECPAGMIGANLVVDSLSAYLHHWKKCIE